MSNMSNSMILAGHSKAVVSSQDGYQQQVLSELDQYLSTHFEDEYINSDTLPLSSGFCSLDDCPMEVFDPYQKSEPESCFDFTPLNENKDGCALQDSSTNAATFSSESSVGFSSGCPSPYSPEGFTSSQVTFPSSSMQTLQYINGNGLQCNTRATTPVPPQLNVEPLTCDNHLKLDLTDSNALNHSSHRLSNTVPYDSYNFNPNPDFNSSDLFLSSYNVDPNINNVLLPSDGHFKLDRSVSPHSSDSGFASPHKLNSPDFQVDGHSDISMLDGTSLFQHGLLSDTFGQDLLCSANKLNNEIDIKPRPIPNKCTLKSTSSLHISKISNRKAGRPKLSAEEKYEKKKESDRKAAQRYRIKKAQQKKEQDDRLAQLTTSIVNMEGQLQAYKQVVRDSMISKFGIEDLDDDKINLICSNMVSICEGMSEHGFPTMF